MRTALSRLMLPLVLAASVAACATSAPRTGEDATPPTYVRVTNQALLDMTVYVIRSSGQRQRLGTVPASRTERFRIPDNVVLGSISLRFLVDPIGSRRTSRSFEMPVSPGDEISLTIPPSAG